MPQQWCVMPRRPGKDSCRPRLMQATVPARAAKCACSPSKKDCHVFRKGRATSAQGDSPVSKSGCPASSAADRIVVGSDVALCSCYRRGRLRTDHAPCELHRRRRSTVTVAGRRHGCRATRPPAPTSARSSAWITARSACYCRHGRGRPSPARTNGTPAGRRPLYRRGRLRPAGQRARCRPRRLRVPRATRLLKARPARRASLGSRSNGVDSRLVRRPLPRRFFDPGPQFSGRRPGHWSACCTARTSAPGS